MPFETALERFLKDTSIQEKTQTWQMQQAEEAVRLFHAFRARAKDNLAYRITGQQEILIYKGVLMDATAAIELFSRAEQGALTAVVCASTVTTVFYLSAKALGSAEGRRMISRLLSIVEVAPVSRAVLEDALASKFTDFEDAVVHPGFCNRTRHSTGDAGLFLP